MEHPPRRGTNDKSRFSGREQLNPPQLGETLLHILDVRPEPEGPGNTIARFDVALTDHLRLYNLRLARSRDGGLRVYSPSAFGRNTATFAPQLASDLARAVSKSLGENADNDRHSH